MLTYNTNDIAHDYIDMTTYTTDTIDTIDTTDENITNLRKKILGFFKYFLLFECVVNICIVCIALILSMGDKKILVYVSMLFALYFTKIFVNYLCKFFKNINHIINIGVCMLFIILFVILLAFGSYVTQGNSVGKYYFCKFVNINILFAETVKLIGLTSSSKITEYENHNEYVLFTLL